MKMSRHTVSVIVAFVSLSAAFGDIAFLSDGKSQVDVIPAQTIRVTLFTDLEIDPADMSGLSIVDSCSRCGEASDFWSNPLWT